MLLGAGGLDLKLGSKGQGASPILMSIVSYWKMDEISNGSVPVTRVDSVASTANNLTDNNTVASAAGIIGNAANFIVANTEYLSIIDNASLRVAGSFSLVAWLNPTTTAGSQAVAAKDNGNTSREYGMFLATGTPTFYVFNAAASFKSIAAAAPLITGSWQSVVGWYDAVADTINVQVNNGAIASLGSVGGLVASGAAAFTIGVSGGITNFSNSATDEVGFWKRVLTAGERTSLYNGGAGLSYPF